MSIRKDMVLLCAILYAYALNAAAQEKSSSEIVACSGQVQLYCSSEKKDGNLRDIIKCLTKNEDKLSVECKQEAQRIFQATRQTTPPGGGPLGALGGMAGPGAQVLTIGYDGRFAPESGYSDSSPSITENNLNISVPVVRSDKNTFAVTLGGGDLQMSDSVTLDSGTKIPQRLNKAEAGFQYSRTLEGHKNWGLRATYGYTGDHFGSETESFSVNANYSYPGSKGGYWTLMLYMSNNSPLGYIPIPGFIYVYKTPTFTGLFGMPILSLQWTPVNPWAFSFTAFGPNIRTEATYGAIDENQIFTAAGWKIQTYMLSDRKEEDERLTFDEKVVEIGLRRPLTKNVFSEVQSGYTFDRSIYIGDGLLNKDGGQSDLEPEWFLKWSLKFAF